MSGISEKQQEAKHARIDAAIEASVQPSPDSVNQIAEQTKETVTIVRRRMLALGWNWQGGRWIWKGKDAAK